MFLFSISVSILSESGCMWRPFTDGACSVSQPVSAMAATIAADANSERTKVDDPTDNSPRSGFRKPCLRNGHSKGTPNRKIERLRLPMVIARAAPTSPSGKADQP
jgi:hypothetical protein